MNTLTEKQVAQFERDGFLNGGRVLSDAEVNELSTELDRIIAKGPDGFAAGEPKPVLFRDLAKPTGDAYTTAGSKPVWQIVNIWEASPLFERFVHHPLIVRAVSRLTGFPNLQVWHDQVQYKPADTGGATGWHQDAPLWPSIEPMTPVSAWVPFDDALIENGCMWMVPGSHKWGNQQPYLSEQSNLKTLPEFAQIKPADPSLKIEVRACPVKRGEVHYHHSLTWHGSPENRSPRPRRALAIHYMTSEARYTGKGHPMQPFIQVQAGEAMRNAGPHFPIVCVNGEPTRRD
jgi:hypothetical protein